MTNGGREVKPGAVVDPDAAQQLKLAIGEAKLAEVGTFIATLVGQGRSPDEIGNRMMEEFDGLWQLVKTHAVARRPGPRGGGQP